MQRKTELKFGMPQHIVFFPCLDHEKTEELPLRFSFFLP